MRPVAIMLALLGSTALAVAQGAATQSAPTQETAKQAGPSQGSATQSSGTGPDASSNKEGQVPGPNISAPANTTQQAQPDQAAPGAMPGSDAAPSTRSAENAAHDKLPIAAYRLFTLTDDEKRSVQQALVGQPETTGSGGAGADVQIGTGLPQSVMLEELPDDIGARLPVLRGAKFARAGDTVLLVEPRNRVVIGVLR